MEESTLWTQEGSPGEEAELRLKEQVGFGETGNRGTGIDIRGRSSSHLTADRPATLHLSLSFQL